MSGPRKLLAVDDLVVAARIEVRHEFVGNIAHAFIEGASRYILCAAGRVYEHLHRAPLAHAPFRLADELLAEAPSLVRGRHGDPVEVVTARAPGARPEAGVTAKLRGSFGVVHENELVARGLAVAERLVHQLHRDVFLCGIEEAGRRDQPPYGGAIVPGDLVAPAGHDRPARPSGVLRSRARSSLPA